ncbi:MAG: hypothetical protein BJ554DRAFT_3181 [Olpidium bornovanus]|uniref:Uncharacterized protein n=1 Tax=Olpidium bornovanus TaxID=278681 RepID=A0A8H8DG38_9FUNG|nr:MAG: hypothetical protein BJ554DRAFT_3181 [Olpidium bornovanus]
MACGAPSAPRALAAVLAAAPRGPAAASSSPAAAPGVTLRHRLLHCPAAAAGAGAPLQRHNAAACVPRRRGRPWRRANQPQARPAGASQTAAPRQYATAAAVEVTPKADDGEEEGNSFAVAEDDTLYHLAMQLLEKNKADRENAAERIAKERDAAIAGLLNHLLRRRPFPCDVAEGTKESGEKARLLQTQVENELVQAEINFPEIDTMRHTRVINDLLPKSAFDRINARLELSFAGEIPRYLQEIHADEPEKDKNLYRMSAPRNANVRAVPLYRALVSPRFVSVSSTGYWLSHCFPFAELTVEFLFGS